MNKLKLTMGLMLVTVLFSFTTQAQKLSFNDVMDVQLRSSGPIMSSNTITGYYFFYKVDKVSKSTSSYLLRILDQNLNEVVKKELTEASTTSLLEATYNGTSLAFKFYEAEGKKLIVKKFSAKGELESSKSIVLSGMWESIYYHAGSGGEEIKSKFLFDIPGKGFVNYTPKKVNKMGYYIDFISTDPSLKDWTYKSSASSSTNESATFMASSDNVILTSISKQMGGAMSKDFESLILGLDMNTGQKLFETKVEDAKYKVVLNNGYPDKIKNDFVLFGQYYNKGDKNVKEASQGLCAYRLDNTGKITSRSYVSWTQDVSKVLPVNEKGKIDKVGYLFFHKIVQTADGKVFAVAESYKKAASGAGIAGAALTIAGAGTSNISVAKIVVEDMYVFQFSPDFTLESVKTFDKYQTSVDLPRGTGMMSPQLLAYYVAAYDGFDYNFTQMNEDNRVFHVCYVDREKEKGEKATNIFGAITYDAGQFKVDKISLETESTRLWILPAKPGYVMISEYYKKLKKIDNRLEKINY